MRLGMRAMLGDLEAMREYPATMAENIKDVKFKKGAIAALRKFKAKKTFKMDVPGRLEAMGELLEDLSKVYDIECPGFEAMNINGGHSGDSYYHRLQHKIVMQGKLSIITLLHEFAHARGKGEKGACVFSLNLFKRVYPKQFEKLDGRNHCAVRREKDPRETDAERHPDIPIEYGYICNDCDKAFWAIADRNTCPRCGSVEIDLV